MLPDLPTVAWSAFIGASVTAVSTLLSTIIVRWLEHREKTRELIIKASLEAWKARTETLLRLVEKTGHPADFYHVDLYILWATHVWDVLLKNNVSTKEIEEAIRRYEEKAEALKRFANTGSLRFEQ